MTEIIVREAEPKDAQNLINFLNQVGKESHFLTLDEVGILMTATQMSEYLAQIAEKDNNAYGGNAVCGCHQCQNSCGIL